MININLKPGAKRQAPKGDALASLRTRLRALGTGVKDPGLLVAAVAWIAAIVLVGGLYLHTQARIRMLEPQLQASKDEYKRYHEFVTEKHHAEKVRDSILAQIGTITAVDQDRFIWSHILDEVAGAVPEATWLTNISPTVAAATLNQVMTPTDSLSPPVSVLIAGQTSDLQNYTAFLRRLGESHWLTNVLPVKTETVIDHDNRPITQFTVQATFVRADTSRIQTVPILESTVR